MSQNASRAIEGAKIPPQMSSNRVCVVQDGKFDVSNPNEA